MSSTKNATAEKPNERENQSANEPSKKGRPTPKRKDQEARNFRPLVISDRKAAKARAKELRDKQFKLEQEGLRTGKEELLPAGHRGQARRFVRNWLDSRYTFCEWLFVVIIVIMTGTIIIEMVYGRSNPQLAVAVSQWVILPTYLILLIGMVEAIILAQVAKRKARAKYGDQKDFPGGLAWYAFARSIMPRRLRSPKVQVARGEKIS